MIYVCGYDIERLKKGKEANNDEYRPRVSAKLDK
jgi:hypothetical protein